MKLRALRCVAARARATRFVLALAVAWEALVLPTTALACPVCFGAAEGPMAEGVNNGILTLLGVVLVVQFGFVALFVGIWRRTRRLREQRERLKVINGGMR